MPMSDPVDSTGPLMKGDDERTPGKLVTLRDVGHTFTGDTWLFRSLNADLRPDRVYALVGPSGSGKSTLLSILAGWVKPSEGSIQRLNIGKTSWVFQNPIGVARRSVIDHVTLPYLARGWMCRRRRHARASCLPSSVWRSARPANTGSCPEERLNGSCWRVAWRRAPICCWSMSRPRSSMCIRRIR